MCGWYSVFFFFQAEDGIRDLTVTGVQTCALPIFELARVAVRHRAAQFLVVTALGAAPGSRIFYSRVKGEAEEAVRRLPLEGIHIFRPSLLIGARAKTRPPEPVGGILRPLVARALLGPLARY